MRPVVIHYHLFKNAGTSVDRALGEAFRQRWKPLEVERGRLKPEAVAAFISNHPEIAAVSSHTAALPVPAIEGVAALPIVFIRHPLDRLRSVYAFEHVQNVANEAALFAREHTAPEYFRWRLDTPGDRSARNFQTARLAEGTPGTESEFERATKTVDNLPFVGLVEAFSESLARLQPLVAMLFPGVQLHAYRENAHQSTDNIDDRLALFRDELGPLYEELEEANHDDFRLWRQVADRYV